jgi:hypothetical protein
MRKDIRKLIRECLICQASKVENVHTPRLLQPLPIPIQSWTNISMDFIEGLPRSNGHSVILVVVDRLTKYGHFFSLSHPFTAISVANIFFTQFFKLHGLPQTIVSVFQTETQCLPVPFGRNCFDYRELLWLLAQLTILNLTVKQKL